eukprot:Gb_07233 [translate_table: standard]
MFTERGAGIAITEGGRGCSIYNSVTYCREEATTITEVKENAKHGDNKDTVDDKTHSFYQCNGNEASAGQCKIAPIGANQAINGERRRNFMIDFAGFCGDQVQTQQTPRFTTLKIPQNMFRANVKCSITLFGE